MEVNNYLKMQKMMMMSNNTNKKDDLYHVIHKVPSGDTPYVRAKHAQLVEKDPEGALVLFWEAINSGDRVDSALKDMAVVMKQLNRSEQAIQAVLSFRGLCSKQAQDSLDNVLIDLYKKCGKVEEQIELLKRKLRLIYQGEVFHGKPTKTARSHGKKFQVSVKQETSRLLGNLGWAYMQKPNYMMAEVVYRKAQMIDPDSNKANNLGLCLMKQGRYSDANLVLQDILQGRLPGSEDSKTRKRAQELLMDLESRNPPSPLDLLGLDDDFVNGLEQLMNERGPFRSKRLPIFEEITPFRDQLAC
ncbi:protein SULFUR DEFICIENCY-INDUCED 1 [Cannabis sativa]|uniref:protein SULFUR DEFICIENCY-INDUCED 1 n=1 Tax=Cannabis sativa TaxID=3483 RepID=UPI0029C9ED18|nr:protein SULFUR DEFICIENCY-INDUCED 1 [Cannabis sativa]